MEKILANELKVGDIIEGGEGDLFVKHITSKGENNIRIIYVTPYGTEIKGWINNVNKITVNLKYRMEIVPQSKCWYLPSISKTEISPIRHNVMGGMWRFARPLRTKAK